MRSRLFMTVFVFIVSVFVCLDSSRASGNSSPAAENKRLALVMGNGAYKNAPLINPVNDVEDMAVALENLGFQVMIRKNACKREMVEAIDEFGKGLHGVEVGLFYYAGHGLQVDGRNYLVPVNAHITSESDVEFEAVDAGRLLGKMEEAENKVNIIILDACRNNPFSRSFGIRERGLARMDTPMGSFLAYATAPGSVAADGTGRNGIFTKHLLKHIVEPGLSINDILMRTRRGVLAETGKKQVPWQSSSLTENFYFLAQRDAQVDERREDGPDLPERQTGRLVVKALSGAAVYVGEEKVGRGEVVIPRLAPGSHDLRIEKEGFEPWKSTVHISPGRTLRISPTMVPLKLGKSRLFVRVRPEEASDAQIRIMNVSAQFQQGIELDAGEYEIEVSKAGYETRRDKIVLGSGEDRILDFFMSEKHIENESWIEPVTSMEFVLVPGGCFEMGSPWDEDGRNSIEGPVHHVCVDGFWLGRYEVTNEQYRKFRGDHDSGLYMGNSLNGDDLPVVNVTWDDAKTFAQWLSGKGNGTFRLPTEAEWEYACRAGTQSSRYWGNDADAACDHANVADRTAKRQWPDWTIHNCDDGYGAASPVGSFRPNDFGLYDMLGNVWEWCEDCYVENAYTKHASNNPLVASGGQRRLFRGGSWVSEPKGVRCAVRNSHPNNKTTGNLGFRLLRIP